MAKTTKKVISVLLAIVLVTGAFAGCGKSNKEETAAITAAAVKYAKSGQYTTTVSSEKVDLSGITADNVNLWLKQVASRPRYKYLITLDDPMSEYRPWWQMIPNLAGSNDNYKSWPSGNMTIASMMFSLPMLTDVLKKRSAKKNMIAFCIACIFVLIYGYNRIHMTNHFLTDVCFGTLITYLIYAGISTAFLRSVMEK